MPRPKLTYANVMATIAVFIALGGVGYAATKLPKNSVGTNQIKNQAITLKKIRKAARTALEGPAVGAPLASGKTERGPWVTMGNSGGGFFPLRFDPPLAQPLDAGHMHYLPSGNSSAECPGPGSAAPGHLCVYAFRNLSFLGFINPVDGTGTSSQTYGVNLVWFTDGSTSSGSGSWALTAP